MLAEFEQQLKRLNSAIEDDPNNVDLYSRRGDLHFFLAQYDEAVADYDRMVELEPKLDSSHWRRGIAYFYAGDYEQAAGQFERYHSFDNVDRENGIWRYLSQFEAYGKEKAREGLLKYEKDDREPFPDVYRLFAGTITADEILQRIADADISDQEREKRLFYAELYIGLELAVSDEPTEARRHLARAAENTWPEPAGYGPRYMWHVARLHRDLIDRQADDEAQRPVDE
ncbi:MAG: hypothetical protein DWQ34_18420 [Planctomycetota bacterium]|nr:MAG: hypothetical protein DWQ29_24610 [Planctomycetota bacterium]REJ89936.1 MAG: hypothetical protein DWQ34_18420 [Planctomycetota bacterium]REK21597.1 MAG: hypothetical protein DWQ41_20980 [Planctomycetota bacterium]REK39935.1 MAG: hypothetical protein DWQ45_01115 [Planctomycetota bacterium]